jgi:phosphotriesterase-related protein
MAKTAAELADAGYIDHLVFSYDRFFRHARGPVSVLEPEMLNEHVDFNYQCDSFVPRLERLGFGQPELHKVLVDNPARLLAFPDPDSK